MPPAWLARTGRATWARYLRFKAPKGEATYLYEPQNSAFTKPTLA